ncbi:hypothetical protein HanRHA438_Chr08g0348211 [Helianthus annuus]|nr:hypothetical protein HanRHA438_Chr08g0348211 [Helianthus annuus]
MLVGLVFMAFGPSYSYSLIRLFYGRKWSDGEAIAALKYYCLYDSTSFSFHSCLPGGWTILLFSCATTLVSEKVFLDRDNFWPTFCVHLFNGFTSFCLPNT